MAARLSTPRLSTLRLITPRPYLAIRTFASAKEPSGDYGSGTGDPKGEKPQDQGANPSADQEHPGPAPPKVGQGSGGATKAGKDGHNTSDAKQNNGSGTGGSQKRGFATYAAARFQRGGVWGKEARPKSTEGLSPKILNEKAPEEKGQSEDVKKHNQDMEKRADRAHEGAKEKDGETVEKGFWKGNAGDDQVRS